MNRFFNVAVSLFSLTVLSVATLSAQTDRNASQFRRGAHEVELSVSMFTGMRSDMEQEIALWNQMYHYYISSPFSEELPRYAVPVNRISTMPYIGAGYRYRLLEWMSMGVDVHYARASFPVEWDKGGDAWDCDLHMFRFLFSTRFYWFSSPLVELYSELSFGTLLTCGNSPVNGLRTLPELDDIKPFLSQKQNFRNTVMDMDFRVLGITVGRSRGIYGKVDGGISAQENGYLRVGIGYRF